MEEEEDEEVVEGGGTSSGDETPCPCLVCSGVIKVPRPCLSPVWVAVVDYGWMAKCRSICHHGEEKL